MDAATAIPDGGEVTVLAVDDEEDVLETYSIWLERDYDLRTVTSGEAALDLLEDAVDVVLLDRLMPGLSGQETLDRIRERDIDCRVVMVTAVEPDFDIIEMGFDAYLTKPIREDELRETMESVLDQTEYEDTLDRYTSLLAQRETLRSRKTEAELDASDEYAELEAEIEALEDELDDTAASADDDAGFVATMRDIDEGATRTGDDGGS